MKVSSRPSGSLALPPNRKFSGSNSTPAQRRQAVSTEEFQRRLGVILIWALLVSGAVGLGGRLYHLQIRQATALQKAAQQQQRIYLHPFVPRRAIVDRTGDILAVDRMTYTVYVHPYYFTQPPAAIAAKLAPLVQKKPEQLLAAFKQAETGIKLASDLPEAIAEQIQAFGLNGVDLEHQQQRIYPHNDLFASSVGYVNSEKKGQAGVEYSRQSQLARSAPTLPIQVTAAGEWTGDSIPSEAFRVDDLALQLTLDGRLQRVARNALRRARAKFAAKRGAVMVMDVRDGSLLALVTDPSYDPNQYFKTDVALFKNWAVSDLYEPGSTFKPINVAIALENKAIAPDSTIYDEGQLQIDGWPIFNNDRSGHGALSISGVLEYSSNVGMVHIMERLQRKTYYDWLIKIGLGGLTGIDLPFETLGNIKPKSLFTSARIEAATHAFGQGFAVTPIQMVQLHAALANGGYLHTPHIARGLVDAQNHLQKEFQYPSRRIFSAKTTQAVIGMMENVVARGTGRPSQISGYRIAGKTGTAQKVNNNGTYGQGRITSFVGIVPAEAPRYVVLAVMDEPQGDNAYGSTVAAPVVKTVMETLLSLEGILPSQPVSAGSSASSQ